MSDPVIRTTSARGDAVRMLQEDHEKILDLLLQFRDAENPTARKGIVDNVVAELETHSLLEEEFVFPTVRRLAGDETFVDQAEADHRDSERIAEELEDTDPADERFGELFNQLTECVTAHIRREEGELFARLRTLGDEELVDMGHKMRERREAALTELREHGPEAPASVQGAT
jgi:hemerythrin superfamily protein